MLNVERSAKQILITIPFAYEMHNMFWSYMHSDNRSIRAFTLLYIFTLNSCSPYVLQLAV